MIANKNSLESLKMSCVSYRGENATGIKTNDAVGKRYQFMASYAVNIFDTNWKSGFFSVNTRRFEP